MPRTHAHTHTQARACTRYKGTDTGAQANKYARARVKPQACLHLFCLRRRLLCTHAQIEHDNTSRNAKRTRNRNSSKKSTQTRHTNTRARTCSPKWHIGRRVRKVSCEATANDARTEGSQLTNGSRYRCPLSETKELTR